MRERKAERERDDRKGCQPQIRRRRNRDNRKGRETDIRKKVIKIYTRKG